MTAPVPDPSPTSSTETLGAAFAAARSQLARDAAWRPPAQAEAAVLAAFDQLHPQAAPEHAAPLGTASLNTTPDRRGGRLPNWLRGLVQSPWGLAATAASVFAVSVLALNLVHQQTQRAGVQIAQSATQIAQNLTVASSGFMPLVSQTELAQDAAGWLVPAELPRAQLAALGLPFDPARADESVRAELLVNAQGAVLAVRVVQ